jgi:conjugal transfer/entry exclusion protein
MATIAADGMNLRWIGHVAQVVTAGTRAIARAARKAERGMSDLRVDYQLLASIHGTLNGLVWEFQNIEDQAGAYDSAYGSGVITAAMGSFSGNWSNHRKTLLGRMQALDQMVAATAQEFHQTDSQLASDLARK